MRMQASGAAKFYARGVTLYPEAELYREMSFIAYYFHWDAGTVMALEHEERRRFCAEISALHEQMMDLPKNPFEV